MCMNEYTKRLTQYRGSLQSTKIPINGRQTSSGDQKRIRNIISNSAYRVAQECDVIVSYPRMRIEGRRVVLGEPVIMLPDCRLINVEQLKDIELGRKR